MCETSASVRLLGSTV
uniref:Uncharacterized protein n=1 Tax=Anguilla anguilla TaxID=7936 RepID=A0A0E9UXU1_ANGAN